MDWDWVWGAGFVIMYGAAALGWLHIGGKVLTFFEDIHKLANRK